MLEAGESTCLFGAVVCCAVGLLCHYGVPVVSDLIKLCKRLSSTIEGQMMTATVALLQEVSGTREPF